ncbi:hypothetical protein JVU11DRAFT_5605 [Chiua virens]|nr:hypothetical protein JVU11DRAFT_5605 [Chiua virens]
MASSGATITAVAVFEHGRQIEGKSYLFDAQIYLGKEKPLLAALRYFNRDNHEFGDIGFYFIIARVAMMDSENGVNMAPRINGPSNSDYDLAGEVIKLIQIRVPDTQAAICRRCSTDITHLGTDGTDTDTSNEFKIDIREIIDPTQLPYVDICGTVNLTDDLACTFTIDAYQYISILKNQGAANAKTKVNNASNLKVQSSMPLMPVICEIPDTPRWRSSKNNGKRTVPRQGTYVAVTGFITGRVHPDLESTTGQRFRIVIESLVFLGRPVITSGSTPQAMSTASSSSARANMKFDFSTPTRPAKRRQEDPPTN